MGGPSTGGVGILSSFPHPSHSSTVNLAIGLVPPDNFEAVLSKLNERELPDGPGEGL